MSLKAKIEAVIYAAEEPVTLSQLAAIFAADVPAREPEVVPVEAFATEAAPDPEIAFPEPLAHAEAPTQDGEITNLDAAGTMADAIPEAREEAAHAAALETAPLVASAETSEGAPPPAQSGEVGTPAEAAVIDPRRAARLREREVRDHLRSLIDELIADYVVQDRGLEIREIAGGYRMATKPEYHDAVRAFVKGLKPPMKLSLQALETLAVIAYKQPVTAPEVAEIRGVDSGGVLASLISRKLVTTAGRKQVIGRPILYKTTKEFLLRFGLKDIAELPSMEEFEKMAGELAEGDALDAPAVDHAAGENPEGESLGEGRAESLPFEQSEAADPAAPPPTQSGVVRPADEETRVPHPGEATVGLAQAPSEDPNEVSLEPVPQEQI